MLTQKEILNEIFTLPITEQCEIAETIKDNIKQNNGNTKNELSVEKRLGLVKSLAGSLKIENPPMTKEKEREIIYEHLSKKYK